MTVKMRIAALALVATVGTAAAADKWNDFNYPDRGFAAQFPATPSAYVYAVAGSDPSAVYAYQASGNKAVYDVSVRQFSSGRGPQNPGSAYFEALANLYAVGAKSVVRAGSGHAQTIAGKPGYEAIVDNASAGRSTLIDLTASADRVFYIVSSGPKGHEASDSAKNFRDGFKFAP